MAKIIVTVGPNSVSSDVLKKLIIAGADVFRINLSHSDKQSLTSYFNILSSNGINPSIDTQGAQLRVNYTSLLSKPIIGDLVSVVLESDYAAESDPKSVSNMDIAVAYASYATADERCYCAELNVEYV